MQGYRDRVGLDKSMEAAELIAAITCCTDALDEAKDYGAVIEEARAEYATDEVEIDDNPLLSVADEGVWVSAWVWVARDEDEDE